MSVAEVALAIADRLPPGPHMERVHDFLSRVSASSMAAVTLGAEQVRKPFFCSGCPHNTSTRLPEGARALAGIGCHYMASFNDPSTDLTSHMGGEGLSWAGASPFTDEPHVFVNLGDGTYAHSGSLAIRASVAMGSHVTYKLLYNDAVAMTGGQHPEGNFSVAQITRQLAAGTRPPIGVVSLSPIRTWLNTAPPFCASPVMSTAEAARPSTCAAMARIEAVVVTPVPPMPVNRMFFTPSNGGISGIGVESAVSVGS